MTDAEARTVIAAVLRGIAPEVDLAMCDNTEPLGRELDLDSMDMLALLTGIGERTGIDIPETDIEADWSLDDLAAYLVET